VDVDKDRALIGRDRTADVRLTDSSVSRKHAFLEHRGDDWVVLDNGSANGTFVDEIQVAEAVIKDGQTLRLGAAAFRVEIEAPPRPTQTIKPSDIAPRDDPKTRPAVPAYRPPQEATVPMPAVMTPAQAAQILGVVPGASAADVRKQYVKLHNDLQIRITNTPSPSLKRMYQKNLQELKVACEILAPGASAGTQP
jgi:hypothetical protein